MDPATEVALFRYQIIAPLLSPLAPGETLKKRIAHIVRRQHLHPLRGPIRVGFGTVEEWFYRHRRDGLDGLTPKSRKDRGKSRRIDDEMAEEIISLAREHPELDGPGILAELKARWGKDEYPLPSLSTLYRFLRAEGLDRRRGPTRRDHRAYAFELAGDCWQADVMYGPSIPVRDGTRRKTYLIAVLDDATRLIPHAQFYFEQHLRSLKDCLKQAFLKRGLCRRLYVDNGKIFRSRAMLKLAARLGMQVIHSRPYRPQGRAKLERWFGTVRRSFLRRVDLDRLEGIDALNRLLFAWIEGEYHVKPHRGIEKEMPLDRWVRLANGIRSLPPEIDLDQLFLEETTRKVARDGTFSLRRRIFEAGPHYIGLRVTVLFDPFDLRRVFFLSGEETKDAFPVDLTGNRRVRREPTPQKEENKPGKPLTSLENLADDRDREKEPEEEDDDER